MRGRFLDITQPHPGIQRCGDERVPERVGRTVLAIPARRVALRTIRPAPWRSSRCPSGVRKTGPPVRSAMARSIARAVRGASAMGDNLAALAGDGQRPVPALEAQVLDVGAGSLGDPQPVQSQQGDERMPKWRAEPGAHQQRAELVAVQRDRVGLIIHSRTADMSGG
jgi:hypothetical protein